MSKRLSTIIMDAVTFVAAAFLLSMAYYVLFALVYSTDAEKKLKAENTLLKSEMPSVEADVALLDAELEYLSMRDENIYKQVFSTELPSLDEILSRGSSEDVIAAARRVEENWRALLGSAAETPKAMLPPLCMPVKDLAPNSIGASVGDRMSPFYKVKMYHDGLDIIAAAGTPVYATADGVVSEVRASNGGKGNMVQITHASGYMTRYANLSQTLVRKGARVKAGACIGKVGDSGRSFTTHLHYEIHYGDEALDPVLFFASGEPTEYLKMLVMSASSGQSMD